MFRWCFLEAPGPLLSSIPLRHSGAARAGRPLVCLPSLSPYMGDDSKCGVRYVIFPVIISFGNPVKCRASEHVLLGKKTYVPMSHGWILVCDALLFL